jgi:hypothetical protein
LHEDFVEASIRQFCASANARLQACTDFDAKRDFLLGHVERVIYNRYKVTIAGSVPLSSASGETQLQFRIEGEIDRKGHAHGGTIQAGRMSGLSGVSVVLRQGSEGQSLAMSRRWCNSATWMPGGAQRRSDGQAEIVSGRSRGSTDDERFSITRSSICRWKGPAR